MLTLNIISDFNVQNFCGIVQNDNCLPKVNAKSFGYGQVVQSLKKVSSQERNSEEILLVWTRLQSICLEYSSAISFNVYVEQKALDEIDDFCRLIIAASSGVHTTFVASWHSLEEERGYGLLDLVPGLGIKYLLNKLNQRLVENLTGMPNIYILDSDVWFCHNNYLNTKLWYAAKVPFHNSVFLEASAGIKDAINSVSGATKKIIICDLDDTLWGGIVGDVGTDGLNLGGHNSVGESFVDFQRYLKSLTRRGILLGIVSKNTEAVALNAIASHPEMILKVEDFAGWRINWGDKAQNIKDLISELKLGLQSVVFLDDNPLERARVRESLPEVTVPNLPANFTDYPSFLKRMRCFDFSSITQEDRRRSAEYTIERSRREFLTSENGELTPISEWLKTLDVKIFHSSLGLSDLDRTSQLFNKTNQMNMTTRRMSPTELIEYSSAADVKFYTFRVSDKFSESGLTGIASIKIEDGVANIADFILSCRVMGKSVEEAIFYFLIEEAKKYGQTKLLAKYIATEKNKPCLEFLERSGLNKSKENIYEWELKDTYFLPEGITLLPYGSNES